MIKLANRILRVFQLDLTVYSEIQNNHPTLVQALLLVILSSLSTGMGNAEGYTEKIPLITLTAFIAWWALVLFIYFVTKKFYPNPDKKIELKSIVILMSFAFFPGIFKLLAFLPAFSFIVLFGTSVWIIGGTVIVVQQIMQGQNWPRAIMVSALGWVFYQWILFQV